VRVLKGLFEEFLKDPPFIPIADVPIGVTYSTQYWVGWPTYKNPYATPWYDFTARSGYLTYLLLKPAARPTTPPTTVVLTQPTTVVQTQVMTQVQTIQQTMVTTVAGAPVTYVTQVPITQAVTQIATQTQAVTITSPAPTMPEWVLPTVIVLVIIIIVLGALFLIRRR